MASLYLIVTVMCSTFVMAKTSSADHVIFEIAYGEGTAVSVLKFREDDFYQFHQCLCNASNSGCLANYNYEPEFQAFYVYETTFLEPVQADQADDITHDYYYSCRKMGLQKSLHCTRREIADQVCKAEDFVVDGREALSLLDNTKSLCGSSCVGIEWNSYQKMRIHAYDNTSITIEACKTGCDVNDATKETTTKAVVGDFTTTPLPTTPSMRNATTDERKTTVVLTKPAAGDSTVGPTNARSTPDASTTRTSEGMGTKEFSTTPRPTSTWTNTTSTTLTSEFDTSSALLEDINMRVLIIVAAVVCVVLVITMVVSLIFWKKRKTSSSKTGKYHLQMDTMDWH